MRREQDLRGGTLSLLDYGCGAGDLMRVLAGLGARARLPAATSRRGMLAEAGTRWPAGLGAAPTLAPRTARARPSPTASSTSPR